MSADSLLASSGSPQVDTVLAEIVQDFEAAFPGRIRGYYLLGSYTDGSAVAISDIDLVVLFKDALGDGERHVAERVTAQSNARSPLRLDLWLQGEADLRAATSTACVPLKLGSTLVYGDDIREALPLPPLPDYTRAVMDAGLFFVRRVLRGVERLVYPLSYSDPAGALFGYDAIHIPEWYPATATRGIKELVTTTTRLATAIVALRAGRYVGKKSESVRVYREVIGDEWAPYLEAVYLNGKSRWAYQVPRSDEDMQLLREMCARTLGFENHFLRLYRTHLLSRLTSADEDLRWLALARLGEVVYRDDEMVAALQNLRQTLNARMSKTIEQAISAASGRE